MNFLLLGYLIFLGIFIFVNFIVIHRALVLHYPGDLTKKAIIFYIIFCVLIVIFSFILIGNISWDWGNINFILFS